MRRLLSIAFLFLVAAPAAAQDMPLSQILIDGEGWIKVEGKPRNPQDRLILRIGTDGGHQRMSAKVDGRELTIAAGRDFTDLAPHAIALSRDGTTAFLGFPSRKAVWAFQVGKDGDLAAGAPYCPLRVPRAHPYLEVRSIAIDRDGRIYAASGIGVQVFDPTGRLCGVLTPAAPGVPESMAFEGDRLTLWIGKTQYTRRLNTTGPK